MAHKVAETKTAVQEYLAAQNRPYSTNDVVANLHNEHGKAAVQRALDLLVAEGAVAEKINGKQKAYVISQADAPAASDQELKDLDLKVKEAEESCSAKKLAADKAEGYVKGMESLPVTSELLSQVETLEAEIASLRDKLKALSEEEGGGKAKLVTKEEVRAMEKVRDEAVQVWKKRKRMCLNVTDAILENYPKSKKVLFEDVGIETEDDLGIKMLET